MGSKWLLDFLFVQLNIKAYSLRENTEKDPVCEWSRWAWFCNIRLENIGLKHRIENWDGHRRLMIEALSFSLFEGSVFFFLYSSEHFDYNTWKQLTHVTEYCSLWFAVAPLSLRWAIFKVILQDLTSTPITGFPLEMRESFFRCCVIFSHPFYPPLLIKTPL